MQYIGFGYDVHQLTAGDNLRLGGIDIPHNKTAVGHSDADVLIHAVCDALLGAANLGDIGSHFPDTDDAFKGIDSCILLQKVVALLQEEGYVLHNADCTICLQKPKIASYIPKMKEVLCPILQCNHFSVKATTTEKLGFVGNESGISAYAVCIIKKD